MNFSTLDLNLLRVLDALLADRSTVKAGQRVGLSQPAVSNALARLRAALGDPLFVRHGQKLVPTDVALSLEMPLRQALDDLQALFSGPDRFHPASADNAFKIGGSDFFAELLMPMLARATMLEAPGIRIQLVDLVPDDFLGTLERHEADLALIPGRDLPSWLEGRPVLQSTFVMVARKGHAAIGAAGIGEGDEVPIDLFCDLGHVVFSPQGHLKAMGDAALARMGRERRVVMTLPVMSGVASAVAASELVGILAEQLALHLAPRLGLSIYRLPIPINPAEIWMIWHRRSSANPAHRWFRNRVADALAPLQEMRLKPKIPAK